MGAAGYELFSTSVCYLYSQLSYLSTYYREDRGTLVPNITRYLSLGIEACVVTVGLTITHISILVFICLIFCFVL
jgi:hypothetical protein